jgi:hypothetical protein
MIKMIDMANMSGVAGKEGFITTGETVKRLGVALSTVQVSAEVGVSPAEIPFCLKPVAFSALGPVAEFNLRRSKIA